MDAILRNRNLPLDGHTPPSQYLECGFLWKQWLCHTCGLHIFMLSEASSVIAPAVALIAWDPVSSKACHVIVYQYCRANSVSRHLPHEVQIL